MSGDPNGWLRGVIASKRRATARNIPGGAVPEVKLVEQPAADDGESVPDAATSSSSSTPNDVRPIEQGPVGNPPHAPVVPSGDDWLRGTISEAKYRNSEG